MPTQHEREYVVYGLFLDSDSEIRYVGATSAGVRQRFNAHKRAARNGSQLPVHRWIRKVGIDSLCFRVLRVSSSKEEVGRDEMRLISEFRAAGAILLNCSDGGEGLYPPSFEERVKHSNRMRGRAHSEETRAKISVSAKAAVRPPHSEETRAKMSASHRARGARTLSDEERARRSAAVAEANRRRVVSDETREKLSSSNRGRKPSEETLAKMRAAQQARQQRVRESKNLGS